MTSACADEGPVHPRIDNAWLTRWTAKRALLPGSGRTSQRACRRTVSSVWVCTAAPCTPGCIWTASVTPEPRGLRRRGSRRRLRALTAATAGVPRSPWGVVFHADGFLESPRVSRRQGLVNALIPQSGDGDGHYGFDHDGKMTSRIYRDGELIDEDEGPGPTRLTNRTRRRLTGSSRRSRARATPAWPPSGRCRSPAVRPSRPRTSGRRCREVRVAAVGMNPLDASRYTAVAASLAFAATARGLRPHHRPSARSCQCIKDVTSRS